MNDRRIAIATLLLLAGALACRDAKPPAPREGIPASLWVELEGEPFELELALDAETRQRGLSGRSSIAANGGMLFVSTREQPQAMVMRDCAVPIDVAFLDFAGNVVALHEMRPELPRRPGESALEYESRLRVYPSGVPAGFAIETAGGRMAELGLAVGDQVALDAARLLELARRAKAGTR